MVLPYMAILVPHQCISGPCYPTRHAPCPQYGSHAVHLDQPVHRADVRITNKATEGVHNQKHVDPLEKYILQHCMDCHN